MAVFPVAFSLMASFMSSIAMLGLPADVYQYSTQVAILNVAYIVGTPIAAYLYLPVFFQLKNVSAYKYLELRFGKVTRLVASMAFIVQTTLYMGVVVYAPALALQAVTGLDKTVSILVIGLVCTFYSTIGGMKAVLITDVFQSLLMYVVLLAVLIKGSIEFGGFDKVWAKAYDGGRIQFFNFSPNLTIRYTFWTQLFGGLISYTPLYATNQTQIQRLLTVRSLRRAQAALWMNLPLMILLNFTAILAGVCVYAFYAECDPLTQGRISVADQLIPIFITDTLRDYPGVVGLCMAGIFSGALSSVSSSINSLAAVVMQDFLIPLFFRETSDSRLTVLTQLTGLVFGALCISIAFTVESLGGVLTAALTIIPVVGGPMLGLFTLGMFSTAVEERGALSGLLAGLLLSFWLGFGGPKPPSPTLPVDVSGCPNATLSFASPIIAALVEAPTTAEPPSYFPLYELSYMWSGVFGFLAVIPVAQIVGRIVTFVNRHRPPHQIDANLLSPCFPQRFRSAKNMRPEIPGRTFPEPPAPKPADPNSWKKQTDPETLATS